MKIANISVKNFKTFEDEHINIKDLTILIGPNASGKSNTIALIKFLSNIINYGIEDAISLMGGIEYIKNASSTIEDNVYIKYELDFLDDKFHLTNRGRGNSYLALNKIIIEFEIHASKRGGNYNLAKNNLFVYYDACDGPQNDIYAKYELFLTKTKTNCNVKKELILESDNYKKLYNEDLEFLEMLKDMFTYRICKNRKELYATKIDFLVPGFFDIDNYIKIYDFDVKKMKNSSSILTAKKLDEEGANLANVLQTILKSKDKKRKFLNILRDILPFITEIQVENNYDKSVSYLIKERYSNKKYYSNFLSDGTVNIIAIVIALYFGDDDEFVVLEEPERNLHPQVLSKIVNMAKEVSKDKQIVITTHNPELIKHSNVENIMLARRNNEGFTKLDEIANNELVKDFLENELGLDELFINGFLGV